MKIMIEPEFSPRYLLGFLKTNCFEIRFKKKNPSLYGNIWIRL